MGKTWQLFLAAFGRMNTILITGVNGQIGRELVPALRHAFPTTHLLGVGRSHPLELKSHSLSSHPSSHILERTDGSLFCSNYCYKVLDVRDSSRLQLLLQRYDVSAIYHLASLLSAKGEQSPSECWDININGLKNILEVAKNSAIQVFWPSSIAVFGATTPKVLTPQVTITEPSTMYGITKLTGELLCQFYARKYQLDIRSLRLPGIISHKMPPGGGTTDYAVEMFHHAVQQQPYQCFVRAETRLPMMYMPDTVRAILALMQTALPKPQHRMSYNITAFSPSAAELVNLIQQHLPNFDCRYVPDYRQAIADSWPSSLDDTRALADWGWKADYTLDRMVRDMLKHLSQRYDHVDPSNTPLPDCSQASTRIGVV